MVVVKLDSVTGMKILKAYIYSHFLAVNFYTSSTLYLSLRLFFSRCLSVFCQIHHLHFMMSFITNRMESNDDRNINDYAGANSSGNFNSYNGQNGLAPGQILTQNGGHLPGPGQNMSGLGLNSYVRGASAASNGTRPNTGMSSGGGKESGYRNRPAPSDGEASALPQVNSVIAINHVFTEATFTVYL